jgi:hypothetical protein
MLNISDSLNSLERFRELLQEDYSIKLSESGKLFTSEGTEITDDTLVLLKPKDTIFIETQPGRGFDNNNILEQYTVLERLGKGGFGSVHKVKHKDTGQLAAIKYIDITDCSTIMQSYRLSCKSCRRNLP